MCADSTVVATLGHHELTYFSQLHQMMCELISSMRSMQAWRDDPCAHPIPSSRAENVRPHGVATARNTVLCQQCVLRSCTVDVFLELPRHKAALDECEGPVDTFVGRSCLLPSVPAVPVGILGC